MATEDSVKDEKRKLTAEEIGKLQVKTNEIIKRVERGIIFYEDALEVMQKIIIEGKSSQHLTVVNNHARIEEIQFLIDGNVQPFIPKDYTLLEHRKNGLWKWKPGIKWNFNIKLVLFTGQKKIGGVKGVFIYEKSLSQNVLNANALDYLLAHQELIPKEWKGKCICFFGTIYRNNLGYRCVRYLEWFNNGWRCSSRSLELEFGDNYYVAMAS